MRERVVPLRRFRDSASLEARTSSNFSLCSASGWSSHSEFCRVSPLDIFHVQPGHVTSLICGVLDRESDLRPGCDCEMHSFHQWVPLR